MADTHSEQLPLRPPRRMLIWPRTELSGAGPVAVLFALVLLVGVIQPSFLGVESLKAVVRQGAIFVLLCAGQTLVILTGGIDLSVASLTSLATVLLALWLPHFGAAACIIVLGLTVGAGALTGYLQAKTQVPSFIATLGALGIWHSLALVLSKASTVSVRQGLEPLAWLNDDLVGVPAVAVVALIVTVVGWAATHWLPIGRYIMAVGGAEPVALLSGVRSSLVRVLVFGASGLSAALAGMALVAQQVSGAPTLADTLLLPGIAAVVIGGTAITGGVGGLPRTVVGALIISVLRVGMGVMGIDPHHEQIVYGLLVIVATVVGTDRTKVLVVK